MSQLAKPDSRPATRSRRSPWVTPALVAVLFALFALPFLLVSPPKDGTEGFAGSDSQATAVIETDRPEYTPWFSPLWQPSSGQIESGLFAAQAAAGGVVLGYVFGALRYRRHSAGRPDATSESLPLADSGV